jgi:hypothetical protein
VHDTYQARILSLPWAMDAGEGKSLVLQRHFALPGSAASVLGTLQRNLIIFATH